MARAYYTKHMLQAPTNAKQANMTVVRNSIPSMNERTVCNQSVEDQKRRSSMKHTAGRMSRGQSFESNGKVMHVANSANYLVADPSVVPVKREPPIVTR
jgi:hypothetical protein